MDINIIYITMNKWTHVEHVKWITKSSGIHVKCIPKNVII